MAIAHILAIHFRPTATPERRQALIDALDEAPERVSNARRWLSGTLGRYYPIATTEYEHGMVVEFDSLAGVGDLKAQFSEAQASSLWDEVVEDAVSLDFAFSVAQESAVAHQRPAGGGDGDISVAHCSILAFKDDVSQDAIDEAIRRLKRAPREEPSIRRSVLGPVQSPPGQTPEYAIAFIDEVDSPQAMEVYVKHPYHLEQLGPALGPIIKKALVIDIAYRRVLSRV